VPADFTLDLATRTLLEVLRGTDTITDVGEGEIVTVDENRADGIRTLAIDRDKVFNGEIYEIPKFPTLYIKGRVASTRLH